MATERGIEKLNFQQVGPSPANNYRLTCKDGNRKTQIAYAPERRLPEAKRLLGNRTKGKKILDELNLRIFKAG